MYNYCTCRFLDCIV